MIRKFFALPRSERALLLEALALIPVFAFLLRCVSLSRLQRWLERPPSGGNGDTACVAAARRMVDAASRYGMVKGTCLEKSLALAWVLRRRGISATLLVGFQKQEKREAHAWLELDGVPVNDSPDVRERYAVLAGAS